jgi:2'-5' RNA ligase
MGSVRTFLALHLPDEIRGAMASVQSELRSPGADVRWEKPEKFHMTLKFLGETPEALIPRIIAALQETARSVTPFDIEYRDVGAFPSLTKPRVLWIGVGDGGPAVTALQQGLEDDLARIGLAKEARPFHPHVTLGRVAGNSGLRDLTSLLEK